MWSQWCRVAIKAVKEDSMKNRVPLTGFIQIAIVVDDMERALDAWCDVLDVERPDVRVTEAAPNPNETYRGQVARYGLKFAVLDCQERGFVIELHETDENPSTFREFLDAHGQGVHHIGFQVGEARDAVVEDLEAAGYTMRTVGMYPDGSWTIVDSEHKLGVNLNIKPHP
jgi:methylmalonyl-CoA/ethylmalonyl-CoA epimerase